MRATAELLIRFAIEGLTHQKGRSGLTMLGIAIGTASVVAVVSIGLLGRAYVIRQIEGVGSNLIYAYGDGEGVNPEQVTFDDLEAFSKRATAVAEMAPVITDGQVLSIKNRPQLVTVLGVTPAYEGVRNLVVESGRFLTGREEQAANKVCVISHELAQKLFGSPVLDSASGLAIRLYNLRFRVVGVFREGVESAAALQKSEAAGLTAIVPFSTLRNLSGVRWLDVVYFQALSPEMVPAALESIRAVLTSRHRRDASFKVASLDPYLVIVRRISDAITLGLMVIAAISLLVGGIGIMNIMLVTVTERTRDIGIRLALGARRKDILFQFLLEAAILAVAGGVFGVLLGAGVPVYVGFLYDVPVPVSATSVAVAFGVSVAVGLFFGYHPARKAAAMNIVDALRTE